MGADAGSKIATRTVPGDQTDAIAKCPLMKARETMQIHWAHHLLLSAKRVIQLVLKTMTVIQLGQDNTLSAQNHADRNYFSQRKLKFETTQQPGQRYETVS